MARGGARQRHPKQRSDHPASSRPRRRRALQPGLWPEPPTGHGWPPPAPPDRSCGLREHIAHRHRVTRPGNSSRNWDTEPMHSRRTRARWRADMAARFHVTRRTSPPATPFSPDRQCSSVVLPEPLGPMMATELPAETSRSTPSRMTRSPANARRPRHPRNGACDALRAG